ncbi:four helix bundle protein [Maribacter sp. 2307ULW6-5]|uniref:four helix bundle protein n=1 Tax=Maribacter sp. 2307ULW6-5 TaxID=3386275 RepID=UPI0039BCCD85
MSAELKERTKRFSLDCWYLCHKLPKNREFDAYVRQLIRSSSSVGANYRAALRAKSTRDVINKLKTVKDETDERMFWLELFQEIENDNTMVIKGLVMEANELLAIVVASINTAKRKLQNT